MSIAAGTRLGPYDVISLIGKGGMGEVYRARDTRLDREVAIKVIPSHLSGNESLRERLDREARTISKLSHPHICTLHDVGHQAGIDYLVMEYLEGETLADRLIKGPIPLNQVIRYGGEIADALDTAHKQGVVHRDLKPGNVMITKAGAKVLDFGLARLIDKPVSHVNETETALPTQNKPITEEGAVLGTVQYMAPEQLEGKEADARSDIFALGALLYEMATGRRPFEGKSKASVIASIMDHDPPPISSVQPMTPPAFDRIVRTCLAKDPEERWQSARDVALELRRVGNEPERQSALRRTAPLKVFAAALALAVMVGGVAGFLAFKWWGGSRSGAAPAGKFDVAIGSDLFLGPQTSRLAVAISPDGKLIAYSAAPSNTFSRLYLRRFDELDAAVLAGTSGGYDPFFSPDGKWLGFASSNRLRKVSIDGGVSKELATVGTMRGATWAPDGTIYYSPTPSTGIWKISADGGTPQQVTRPDSARGENSHRWPEILQDGKHLLFTVRTDRIITFDQASIAIMDLSTGKRRTLVEGASYGRYLPTGHLLFCRSAAMYAVALNLETLSVVGAPVKVQEGVMRSPSSGVAQFAVSNRGTATFVRNPSGDFGATLLWVDQRGEAKPVTDLIRTYEWPRISPDGKRIAVTLQTANDDIWMYDLERTILTRFSSEPGDETSPTWTRDGSRVVFTSLRADGTGLMWKTADGVGHASTLLASPHLLRPNSWSRDGKTLVYGVSDPKSDRDLYLLSVGEPAAAVRTQPFLLTPYSEFDAEVSPDGNWVALVSNEAGVPNVFVRRFKGDSRMWQISPEGGAIPRWSADGRRLYYRLANKMFAVDVKVSPSFSAGKPRLLFEKPFFACGSYDVARDGAFLMCAARGFTESMSRISIMVNWFDEMERLVERSRADQQK